MWFCKEPRQMEGKQRHFTSLSLLILLLPIVHGSSETFSGKHFVLVHGACHGAWSWYKIIAPLKSYGYNVTAIDLAASVINPKQTKTLQSISDYHRPLMEFMASLPPHEKVILVGHSLGGLAISQAMERFQKKVSLAVFVSALMPGPELSVSTLGQKVSIDDVMDSRYGYDDGPNKPPATLVFGAKLSSLNLYQLSPIEVLIDNVMDSHSGYDDGPNKPPTTLVFGPKFLSLKLYQLSPIEDWVLATTLVRPVRLFSENLSKNIVVTKEKYGSVDRVYIISEKDEAIKKEIQLWMTERNPPNEVLEIFGSDHMVMMSKPRELCTLLLKIAMKYD